MGGLASLDIYFSLPFKIVMTSFILKPFACNNSPRKRVSYNYIETVCGLLKWKNPFDCLKRVSNMLNLFNTFSLRLSRIIKMMMMDLNKFHVCILNYKFCNFICCFPNELVLIFMKQRIFIRFYNFN